MAFIDTIPDAEVDDQVRAMYERQASFWGFVPNYAKVFCYRPEIMGLWAQLQAGIKKSMADKRRYELVTFAAANALRSTLCSLAHGKTLTEFFPSEAVQAMARGEAPADLTAAEAEMMKFARKVGRDASSVTREDVLRLRELGFSDAEVFDIAAAASARAFFSKLVESLGVTAEHSLLGLDQEFKRTMAVGRPVEFV
jgi:uncharacterized peroxidase-related enzyme